jgi:hypothetical protein
MQLFDLWQIAAALYIVVETVPQLWSTSRWPTEAIPLPLQRRIRD